MAEEAQPVDQMAVFSHHFRELQMEMRAQGVYSQIRTFSGEGNKQFSEWVRDLERARVTLNATNERMRILALQSLSGPAAEYCSRILRDQPEVTWEVLKESLKTRYSDMSDMLYARQTLRKLKQGKGESVQNFYDRLISLAEEAFDADDIGDDVIQQQIIEIFVDGLTSDPMARKLIRSKPNTLENALKLATEEQQATRSFALRRGTGRSVEPMEVDNLDSSPSRAPQNEAEDRLTAVEETLGSLVTQVTQLVRNQENGPSSPQRTYAQVVQGGPRPSFTPQSNMRPVNPTRNTRPENRGPTRGTSGNTWSQTLRWTPDGSPICHKCGQSGHIGRECQSRQRGQNFGNPRPLN